MAEAAGNYCPPGIINRLARAKKSQKVSAGLVWRGVKNSLNQTLDQIAFAGSNWEMKRLMLLVFLLPTGFLMSQEKVVAEKPAVVVEQEIKARVVSIYETRRFGEDDVSFTGDVRVKLLFEAPVEGAELLSTEVISATDAKGTNLLNPRRAITEARERLAFQSSPKPGIESDINLKAGPREAESIAEITGIAVFQDPAKAMKPVDISDYKKTPGEFIPNEVLEKAGLSVAYLDEETFDDKGAKILMKSMGMLDDVPEEMRKSTLGPMKMVFGLGASLFVVKDPNDIFIKIEGLDADGEKCAMAQSSLRGLWILTPSEKENAIATVRIHLKSAEAEIRRRFSIKDVKLP